MISSYRFWCFFYALLPIVPLLNAMLFVPYGSPKVAPGYTAFPYLDLFLLLCISILTKLRFRINGGFLILFFIYAFSSLVTPLLNDSMSYRQFPAFVTLLFTAVLALSNIKVENREKYFAVYFFSFFFTTVAIYIVRMFFMYDDLMRVRGGTNIYGGSTLYSLGLLYFLINVIVTKGQGKYLLYLFLLWFISIIFILRVGLILSFFITLGYIVLNFHRFLKNISLKQSMFFIILMLFSAWLLHQYWDIILDRFWLLKANNINLSMMSHNLIASQKDGRLIIWQTALAIIKEYPLLGVGFKNFINFNPAHFSGAHSLLLNNFVENGLFLGFILNLILFYPIVKFFKIALSWRHYGLLLMLYGAFLLQSFLAGQQMVDDTNYPSGCILLFFSFFLVYSVQEMKGIGEKPVRRRIISQYKVR